MTEAPDLHAVTALLRDAVHSDARGLTDEQSCERAAVVEEAGRLIDALRVASAADLARRSRPELGEAGLARRHGCRTGAQLLERIARVSGREAARRAHLGAVLAPRCAIDGSPLPAQFAIAGAAVESGQIGLDAVWAITRALGQAAAKASPVDLEAAEESLVAAASSDSADLVAVQARLWREALDPDGAEPREEELRARRELRLGREVDGMTPFHGWADPTSAAVMRAAVSERTSPYRQPRFVQEGDPDVDCEGCGVFGEDRRTRPQKSFDAFIGLLQAGIRADAQATGSLRSVGTVNVVVSLDHLISGSATPSSTTSTRRSPPRGPKRSRATPDTACTSRAATANRSFRAIASASSPPPSEDPWPSETAAASGPSARRHPLGLTPTT